jgi:glucose-1-phosphate adenylyltransferase
MERVILVPSRARTSRQLSRTLVRRRSPQTEPRKARSGRADVKDVVAVILGGGRGNRLFPLTYRRAKPAVPVGGKYRLVDIAISNCLNSDLRRIFLLTQFNSASLNRHVAMSYRFDHFSKSFLEILAAEQTERSTDWYQGTADAVRKQLDRIRESGAKEIVILSGDHLYNMDLRDFIARHREAKAEISVAVTPVSRQDAPQFGLLHADKRMMITEFAEKPTDPKVLDHFAMEDPATPDKTHLASMGIYVFEADVLQQVLSGEVGTDFGKDVIPAAIKDRPVAAYTFDGYWEDLGTIKSYHRANLSLTEPLPRYNFFLPDNPVYTRPRFLPASKINRARLDATLISEGCILEEDVDVRHSVLGIRSHIRRGTRIHDSVILGASTYELQAPREGQRLGIGENCSIKNAIVDRDVRIGDNVVLENRRNLENHDGEFLFVRDGVIVVPCGMTIPSGFVF